MIAYLTSFDEKTARESYLQLNKLGFKTTHNDKKINWYEKYKEFVIDGYDNNPVEGILRIDADVIIGKYILSKLKEIRKDMLMVQFEVYCLYQNEPKVGNPVWYSPKAFKIIRENLDKIDKRRPETSAWRLPEINEYTQTIKGCVGFHGFYQDKETIKRAIKNKEDRGQMENCNFTLAERLNKLL